MERQYLVIYDGYLGNYGTQYYLLGIYDTKDKAEEAIENLVKTHPELHRNIDFSHAIKEVELNKTLEVEDSEWADILMTDICLGGYIE